jgi:phosphoglycolate phosphatase
MTPLLAPDAIDTVLFDLDGTLVDNFTAIHKCYALVAEELGFAPKSYDEVRGAVGGSITVTIGKLLPAEVGERAVALYRQKFPDIMHDGLFAYEGVEKLVRGLHTRGYKVAVFTNKDAVNSRKLLQHLGFDELFHRVIGTGESPWRKPEAEFTRHALELMGASPSRTVMIGDSPFDIAAARNGGLLAVHCVTTGSHTAEQLTHDSPDGIHADMTALGRAVFGLE